MYYMNYMFLVEITKYLSQAESYSIINTRIFIHLSLKIFLKTFFLLIIILNVPPSHKLGKTFNF